MSESATPPEHWLPVVGWEGLYGISDRGRAYSRRVGRIMKPAPDGYGHLQIMLCRNGKSRPGKIHRLVLIAFAEPCPPGMEACHGEGGRQDNRWPENLYWGTHRRNMGTDRERDGTSNQGEQHGMAKLTEADVAEIRRRVASGETQAAVARGFSVTPSWVSMIVNRKYWAHC